MFWKVYELVYLEQNLFEREDVLPPCEYFKPTYQVIRQYVFWKKKKKHLNDSFPPNCQVQKNLGRVYDNITNFASITFSPQVGRQICVSSRSKTPHILYISVTFLAKRSLWNQDYFLKTCVHGPTFNIGHLLRVSFSLETICSGWGVADDGEILNIELFGWGKLYTSKESTSY